MKTPPHSQNPLFSLKPLWQILGGEGKKREAAMRLPLKSPSGVGVSEMPCMLILYLSAQTSYTWLFLSAPSASFLFTFRFPITSSHSHLFPFPLLLLIVFLLKQWSHFNVNSICAYPPLNPAPSFCADFLQIPEKLIRETCICLWGPSTQYVLHYLIKGNAFFFMWSTDFLFSAVCARATFPYGITFMMHDKARNSLPRLCSTVRLTRAVQKSRLWQRGSLYIFLSVLLPLCILLHASMKSVFILPSESIATRCTLSPSLSGGAWNECPIFGPFHHHANLHACVHTFTQPADPASCFIVNISRLRGCMGWRLLTGAGLWR